MSIALKLGAGFGTVLAIFSGYGLMSIHESRAAVGRVEEVAQLWRRAHPLAWGVIRWRGVFRLAAEPRP
jgi:hypothetical protein